MNLIRFRKVGDRDKVEVISRKTNVIQERINKFCVRLVVWVAPARVNFVMLSAVRWNLLCIDVLKVCAQVCLENDQ